MNIFVTGGTGFVGSNLISRLTSEKGISKVVALARNQEKARDLAERIEFSNKLEFVYGDLRNYAFDFSNIDVIIHLAGIRNILYIEKNRAETVEVNVGGTLRLVEAVWKFKVPYFIFISGRVVYGEQDSLLLREDYTPRLSSVKSLVKYACEVVARSLADSSTKFGILRFSHPYGSGIQTRCDDLSGQFVQSCLDEKDLTIHGNGNQTVDLVHVRDVCDCIYKLLISSDSAWNETYNIGGGRAISINELAEACIKAAPELRLKVPGKDCVDRNIAMELQMRQYASSNLLDISKAREILDWIPSTSIEQGMKELLQACLKPGPAAQFSPLGIQQSFWSAVD